MGFGEGGHVGPNHGLDPALVQTVWLDCNTTNEAVKGDECTGSNA